MTFGGGVYPSYRRNNFPSITPYTQRVQADNPYAPDEIDYVREAILAGLQRTGQLFAHHRRYTADWNVGACPRCYNWGSRGAVDPTCDICFGTGWKDGYSRATVQRMLVKDWTTDVKMAPTGLIRVEIGDSYAPSVPRLSPNDVIVHIYKTDLEWKTGDRYLIADNIEEIRSRSIMPELPHGTEDHLDATPEVVGYKFRSSKIPPQNGEFINPEYRIPFTDPIWLAT